MNNFAPLTAIHLQGTNIRIQLSSSILNPREPHSHPLTHIRSKLPKTGTCRSMNDELLQANTQSRPYSGLGIFPGLGRVITITVLVILRPRNVRSTLLPTQTYSGLKLATQVSRRQPRSQERSEQNTLAKSWCTISALLLIGWDTVSPKPLSSRLFGISLSMGELFFHSFLLALGPYYIKSLVNQEIN